MDAEVSIIDEHPGLAGFIKERQRPQPTGIGGADNLFKGIVHANEFTPLDQEGAGIHNSQRRRIISQ